MSLKQMIDDMLENGFNKMLNATNPDSQVINVPHDKLNTADILPDGWAITDDDVLSKPPKNLPKIDYSPIIPWKEIPRYTGFVGATASYSASNMFYGASQVAFNTTYQTESAKVMQRIFHCIEEEGNTNFSCKEDGIYYRDKRVLEWGNYNQLHCNVPTDSEIVLTFNVGDFTDDNCKTAARMLIEIFTAEDQKKQIYDRPKTRLKILAE